MNKLFSAAALLLFSVLLILFSGCTPQRPETDPTQDSKAMELSFRARAFNQTITKSKGFGWVITQTREATRRYRIAWAAESPNRVRLTFMMFGKPLETITATGRKVSFFSHTGQHPPYTVSSPDPDMSSFIQVPVKLSEIITILLGRLPIRPHDDAYFFPRGSRSAITLFDSRTGPVQQAVFDSRRDVVNLTAVNSRLEPRYTYQIKAFERMDNIRIPASIKVSDSQGQIVTLTITRFIANPEIKPHVFVLTEGG